MTRKKTTASGTPVVPAPPKQFVIRGPDRRDNGLYLAREDLLQLELYQMKTLASLQSIALAKNNVMELTRKYEEALRGAQAELAAVTGQAKQWEEKTAALGKEMSEIYGVDFTQTTYDDETGRITVLNQEKNNG